MKVVQKSYQVEENVETISFVPLWGNDFGSPYETIRGCDPTAKMHT